jgi:hypothetical protein
VHDFYSSHVHQMANQARQSPPESVNAQGSSPAIHNASSSYYHHYHSSSIGLGANQSSSVAAAAAGYSPPTNQSSALNGNESPNSVDQFTSNPSNNIQLPDTPNSLVTTMMGPTSGNSNSNDGTNGINESSASENASINNNNNNNYSPWCATAAGHHHQLPLSNSPSYNTAHHGSLYSAHHNLSSTLLPHQNISSFAHPHSGKAHSFGMSQPFYSWY